MQSLFRFMLCLLDLPRSEFLINWAIENVGVTAARRLPSS